MQQPIPTWIFRKYKNTEYSIQTSMRRSGPLFKWGGEGFIGSNTPEVLFQISASLNIPSINHFRVVRSFSLNRGFLSPPLSLLSLSGERKSLIPRSSRVMLWCCSVDQKKNIFACRPDCAVPGHQHKQTYARLEIRVERGQSNNVVQALNQ